MQSHNADLGGSVDASFKLSKLADLKLTTKRMEEEYRSMAYALISQPKTPNPYTESTAQFETVTNELNELLWQLDQQKETNQNLITAAYNGVVAVNTQRDSDYEEAETGVNAQSSATTQTRSNHDTCRTTENVKIEDRNSTCSSFVAHTLCSVHKSDYTYFANEAKGDYSSVPNKLLTAIGTAKECKEDLREEVSQSSNCDYRQRAFELAYCLYFQKLTDTCSTLDTNYATANSYWNAVNTAVTELETEQKIVFRMIQKVKCYVDKISNNFNTLQASDIKFCEDKDYLAMADQKLSITKSPPPNKAACDKSSITHGEPGQPSWEEQEYVDLHHKHDDTTYHGTSTAVNKIEHILDCTTRKTRGAEPITTD